YPTFDDVKRKRSLSTDLLLIKLHLKPFFGRMLLTEIAREALTRNVDARLAKTLIRGKKGESKKAVSRGTVSNELSLFVVCFVLHYERSTRSLCRRSRA